MAKSLLPSNAGKTKKLPPLKKAAVPPKMPKVKKAKGPVTWKNKTVARWKASPNLEWRAQLSICSDGRKFRSIKQVIIKKDGTENHLPGGMTFTKESGTTPIKKVIKLLQALLPEDEQ
jgi:hypothetical protein